MRLFNALTCFPALASKLVNKLLLGVELSKDICVSGIERIKSVDQGVVVIDTDLELRALADESIANAGNRSTECQHVLGRVKRAADRLGAAQPGALLHKTSEEWSNSLGSRSTRNQHHHRQYYRSHSRLRRWFTGENKPCFCTPIKE